MNKKLILKISTIVLLNFNNHYELIHASDTPMMLPQNESQVWKWSPFRMGSHLLWGKKLGQDFWETNSSELGTALSQFKNATNNEEKSKILKNVMEKSAKAYEGVIEGLQSNYRTAMSYIIEQFQNETPDSTIIYFPDHKLVTMYKKDAPDSEKAKIMFDLLKETKRAMEEKEKNVLNISPVGSAQQPNPHSTTTTTTITTVLPKQ